MTRKIKFRGKSLSDGRWLYGDLFRTDLDGEMAIQFYDEEDGWMTAMVRPETVGQFTGLIDKNGKEVYEGDIVKIKTLQGIVTWHPNGYFCIHTYKCDISEVSYTAIGDMVDYLHKDLYDDGLEVIGNTFDNSDLLKGGAQ